LHQHIDQVADHWNTNDSDDPKHSFPAVQGWRPDDMQKGYYIKNKPENNAGYYQHDMQKTLLAWNRKACEKEDDRKKHQDQ